MRVSVVVPAIIFVLSAQNLMAQAPSLPSPDPRIMSVIEGCMWVGEDNHGTYRIVLWNEGFEHVSSGVIAEWMVDPEGENEPRRVVHSERLVDPGMFSLQDARIVSGKNPCTVVVKGVSTYRSTEKISCTFALLPDKTTRAIKPCR